MTRTLPVVALAALLASAAALLQFGVLADAMVVVHIEWLPWWALLAVFYVVERYSVYFEWGGHSAGHSLVELPILLGLAGLGVHEIAFALVAGQLAYRASLRPQPWLKTAFNVAFAWFEIAVLLTILVLVVGAIDVTHPATWAVVITALVGTTLLGNVLIAVNVRFVGGDWQPMVNRRVMTAEALAVSISTAFAIVVTLAVIHHPDAAVLATALTAVLLLAYRQHRQATDRYELLRLIGAQLDEAASVGSEDGWTGLLHQVAAMFNSYYAEVTVFDLDADGGAVRYALGPRGTTEFRMDAGETALAERRRIAAHRRPHLVDARALPSDISPEDGKFGGLASPLVVGGQSLGLLLVAGRASGISSFSAQQAEEFGIFAARVGEAIAQGKLLERLREEVAVLREAQVTDAETGLPTHSAFYEAMHDRPATRAAFAVVSVTNLSEINHTFGRVAGDAVLTMVAARLSSPELAVSAYRFPGAKFVLVIPDPDSSLPRLQAVMESVNAPFEHDGGKLLAEAYCGVAVLPDDGADPNAVLESASLALNEGRARHEHFACYRAPAGDEALVGPRLKGDLAAAILDGSIEVYFQPQVVLRSGHLYGAEALARWRHPRHGFVRPDIFIPMAEQAGLIHNLTMLILRKALAACREWHHAGHEIGVSVNLSAYDLRHDDLPERVGALLDEFGVLPRRVTLEMTESILMDDVERSTRMTNALHDVGVRVSVDDFGTGYSSLAYLARLPLDELKIDRSFVAVMQERKVDSVIVETLVELGTKLGMTVVAEGVETGGTLRKLTAMGCDKAQGYFIARPMDATSFREWLVEGNELDWRGHQG